MRFWTNQMKNHNTFLQRKTIPTLGTDISHCPTATKYLRVFCNTIYKMTKENIIPVLRIGRLIRINRTDINN